MQNKNHDDEGPDYSEAEILENEDIKASAEIAASLEENFGNSVSKILVRMRSGNLHIQGAVSSKNLRGEIETYLQKSPGVRELNSYLTVVEDDGA